MANPSLRTDRQFSLLRAASCVCVTAVAAACFTLPATETVTSEAPVPSAANAPICEPAAIVVDSRLLNERSLSETLREYEGWWPAEMRAYPVPLAYPGITNLPDVNKAIENALPTGMSDNAVTGTTIFAVLIDVEGVVRNSRIVQRSGERGIDQATTRALPVARFNPMRAPSGCRAMHLVRVPLHFSSRAPAS